jgi:glycerophosphoryl diester phosphodiesterase
VVKSWRETQGSPLPLNIAHRGASRAAPGNTLAAFRLAADMGADGIEFDVHVSADGVPVVIHDFTVDRTTDGTGAVSSLTVAQLQQLDAGSTFGPAFAGERIPTLDQVLDRVDERLLLNIELKAAGWRDTGLEQAVVRRVLKRGLEGRCLLSSFNPLALRRASQLAPNLLTALIYAPNLPLPLRGAWLAPLAPHQFRHPEHTMVDAPYMTWARRRGYRVSAWTVDEPEEMKRLIALGVDGIVSNCPDVLGRALDRATAAQKRRAGP